MLFYSVGIAFAACAFFFSVLCMLNYVNGSLRSGAAGPPGSPVRFQPPYFVKKHIAAESASHYARQFFALLGYPGHL